MESTNPMLSEGVEIDWRKYLPVAARQKVVARIVEWLVINIEPQESPTFKELALKFEEKIFSITTSKDDYRRKINVKLQQKIIAKQPESPAYSVESSVHQANYLPQYHVHGRPLEIQPRLDKHQSSFVHPLSHQKPDVHYQETLNETKFIFQNQQNPNSIDSQWNGQQKDVPNLLSQCLNHGRSVGSAAALKNYSGRRDMHHLGEQVNSSTFNGQFGNFGVERNPANILNISRNKHEIQQKAQQAQPILLQTSGLQQGSQLINMQVMSPMHVHPRQVNTQVMAEGISQTSHSVGDDWKEQLHNKITKLKDLYLPALIVQHGKIAQTLQNMDSISPPKRTNEYFKLRKLLHSHKKLISFLNFSKDQMTEEVRIWFLQCEKQAFFFLQRSSQGNFYSPEQEQSPKEPIILQSQVEDRELQKSRKKNVAQHNQQSVNLVGHHSSQFSHKLNKNIMQNMEAEIGKIACDKSVSNRSLSNAQPAKSQPSQIDINISEKSLENIEKSSLSPFSADSLSASSVQNQIKKNANIRGIHSQAISGGEALDRPLVISVAGESPSGLISEIMVGDGNQINYLTTNSSESSVTEEPIQRLINAARSMSQKTFSASVSDMESTLRMADIIAGQISGNGSEFTGGEDLAAATRFYCKQKRDFNLQENQKNIYATEIPSRTWNELFQLESSIAIPNKRLRFEVNSNLLEEITKINRHLIETVLEISQHDFMSETVESLTESCEGTTVRCSYTPMAVHSNILGSPIMPLKLLVPINYPALSPVIMDKLPSEIRTDCEDLSEKAKSKLILSLRVLSHPMSLADIARSWDNCARAVISEFAQKLGGGNFSSKYGTWTSCPSAA